MYSTIVHILESQATSTRSRRPTSSSSAAGWSVPRPALAVARRGSRVALLERPRCRRQGSSKGTHADLRSGGLPGRVVPGDGSARPLALARDRAVGRRARCCGRPGRCTTGAFAEQELVRSAGGRRRGRAAQRRPTKRRVGSASRCPANAPRPPPARRGGDSRRPRARRRCWAGSSRGRRAVRAGAVRTVVAEAATRSMVETDRRRWSCVAAIVTAGPWSGDAAGRQPGSSCRSSVSLQSVAYFDLARSGQPPPWR